MIRVKRSIPIALLFALVMVFSSVALANELVIVRSQLTESATANYPTYGENMDYFLEFLNPNYDYVVLSDQDVIEGKLAGAKLVILNDQGVMDSAEIAALWDFVRNGGKVLATYSTSLRTPDLQLVGFQLSDMLGVTWQQWTPDADFDHIAVQGSPALLAGLGSKLDIPAAHRQKIAVTGGTAVGFRADASGSFSENDDAVIVTGDYGTYVAISLFTEIFLVDNPPAALLIEALIDHYAPGARR